MDIIENLLQTSDYDQFVIGGDFNTDYARNNAHANYLNDFVNRNNMKDLWNENLCDDKYTYLSSDLKASSCIDHIILSNTITVYSFNALQDSCNPSCHSPIKCHIAFNNPRIRIPRDGYNAEPRIAWHKVTSNMVQEFQKHVDHQLRCVQHYKCLQCADVNCTQELHLKELDDFCAKLTDILVNASQDIFPLIKASRKAMPKWSAEIKPLKEDSIFWHWVWTECGRPTEGAIVDLYKSCKRRYHYAVRRIRRQERALRNAQMAEHISNNNTRDFWREVSKIKPRSKAIPPHIDGLTDNMDICDSFAKRYKTLYNSLPSDCDIIEERIKQCVKETNKCHFNLEHINKAINKLKKQKDDGDKGLVSDMVILSSELWRSEVVKLINAMFVHGYYPFELRKSTISSLPKDLKGNLCDGDNFRGIALSSPLNKVIDWIILLEYRAELRTSDLQFAFKEGSSTAMCTLMLKEVAAYYKDKGGYTFCTMLDASKAFDRLRYDKLFEILEQRGLHPMVTRLLINLYKNQVTRTRWLDKYSEYFQTSNGIRQGGVASPVFFTLYMDALIQRLEKSKVGCYIGQEYYGILCYADDVTLIAPTASALQKMVNTCENFAKDFDVRYNPKKSMCIQLCGKLTANNPKISLNGELLMWYKCVRHLGNVINTQINDQDDIKLKKNDFIARTNSLIVNFKAASRSARIKLFSSKCCFFYGSQSWALDSKPVQELEVCWRKAARRLLGLPYQTRSAMIPYLLNCDNLNLQLCYRFVKLLQCISRGNNIKLKWMLKTGSKTGTVNSNIEHISRVFNCNKLDVTTGNVWRPKEIDKRLVQKAAAIFDFMDMFMQDDSDKNLHDIFTYLCIS